VTYTLRKDGDREEKLFGHYLEFTLPNYEVFWERFVVPLTKRPENIKFRDGLDPILARMAEIHYSMFWHLVAAHRFLDMCEPLASEVPLLFQSIMFHLGVATEMVEDFLFIWARIQSRVVQKSLVGVESLSADEACNKARTFVGNRKYRSTAMKEFVERGRPVSIRLHVKRDVFDQFLHMAGEMAEKSCGKFHTVSGRVRHYRNAIVHNPVLGKLVTKQEKFWLPKEPKLSKYDEWMKVIQSPRLEDFTEATQLAGSFLRETEEVINELWEHVIPHCMTLAVERRYLSMIPDRSLQLSVHSAVPADTSQDTAGSATWSAPALGIDED